MNKPMAESLARHHTLRGVNVLTSEGVSEDYLDGVAMLLANPQEWREYFEARLRPGLWPVAAGRSGAVILGILGRGSLYNLDKPHGIPWANASRLAPGTRVALVDDCSFTGITLDFLHAAAVARGLVVVRHITAWPWCPLEETPPAEF